MAINYTKKQKQQRKLLDNDSEIFNQGHSTNTSSYPYNWLSTRTQQVSKFQSILEPAKVHLQKGCGFDRALGMIK